MRRLVAPSQGPGALPALCLLLALAPSPARAHTYLLDPAPSLATPSAAAYAPLALSAWRDTRRHKELWQGMERARTVFIEARGLSLEARAWDSDDYGPISFLWQRQLACALADAGFSVAAAGPATSTAALQATARDAGRRLLLDGEIRSLGFLRRGADTVGTTFSGVNYTFTIAAALTAQDLGAGKPALARDWTFSHTFYDGAAFGSEDSRTFPVYTAAGLSLAAQALACDPDLRALAGLAPCAPPAPAPASIPAAGAAPGTGYWANPKTGAQVDPAWNFDPYDGTPRKDFVFHPGTPTSGAKP